MDWNKLLSNKRIKKSKPLDIRNEFESDYGRIIYSPALRRMHDKTQVFPLTTDDNIHSRLTHSNEVMSLGYTFGLMLCKSKKIQKKTGKDELGLMRILPILLQNVCLIHDIGNAPFGHFGETIVSDYFKNLQKTKHPKFTELTPWQKRDFFNYDGNAQGLRVITKLQYLDNPYGLNLTFATLASYLKYPNHDEINDNVEIQLKAKGKTIKKKFIEKSKHGVFFSERAFFDMIIKETGLKNGDTILRHPLCYLMEAADSIAYLCMDMEDGFNKGVFDISYIKDCFIKNTSKVAKRVIEICNDELMNPTTKMVNVRIKLIRYFVDLAFANFEKNLDLIESGKYGIELIKDDPDKIYKILQGCSKKIFASRDINYLESTGYAVFKGLLDFYVGFLFHENPKYVKRAKSLISKSVIDAALDENLIEISERKLAKILGANKADAGIFKHNKGKLKDIKEEREKLKKDSDAFIDLKKTYSVLLDKQIREELSDEDLKQMRSLKKSIEDIINPEFEDLDDYFKFRVILDFISGMTDQFALNHYQKLSGQKII
ncbi:dNTP triphosphohydrolase [Sediminibacterium roseum]|uniref:DNTP triphosphohydrolase n=1 Tax=Sediminibacterium roseum TaxID=1978412 RepID=A0ABW9ZN58_9BACT|nr:dNTP triphosphohydrolase [Sediminibacterium roseum]NCI48324.1 dNTP triphosphohydrolase [Sediminibacterium roseum]